MHKKSLQILLAEDDPNLGTLLVEYLQLEGFTVKLCKNGALALNAFQRFTFDICLLDIMMPELDGFSLAKAIRDINPKVPFLFITAKSLKHDKQSGYNLGAEDYIIKPFDEEELLWKIKAIIRRHSEPISSQKNTLWSIGKYQFNYTNQSLTIDGNIKRMTEKETAILHYLCTNQNTIVKREDLLKELWGENDYFLGRSLDVFIVKIRKYLQQDPSISIETVFGVGFMLRTLVV